jgi:hypothetical protein
MEKILYEIVAALELAGMADFVQEGEDIQANGIYDGRYYNIMIEEDKEQEGIKGVGQSVTEGLDKYYKEYPILAVVVDTLRKEGILIYNSLISGNQGEESLHSMGLVKDGVEYTIRIVEEPVERNLQS